LVDWSLAGGPLTLSQNARFDKSGKALEQSEAKARLALASFNLSLGHSFYERAQTSDGAIKALEEATGTLDWRITRHWRLAGEWRENLKENKPVRADAALSYEDDCTIAKLSVTRDYARIDGTSIEPETRINFTFTLKTIGG
jgi:lipopolysaccharide assembly outer membrane protein LptD (OstA)